ncbi:MAG TPA: hypothetical protein VE053_03735 [Allosphingosinicella sp.]|nr:hypothetical protein [Allosphingosinicella sp.]
MVATLNDFADVQNLLNAFVASAGVTPQEAPHHTFWNTDYQSFMQLKIFGKYQVVVPKDVAASDIIAALNGTLAGIPRMPRPSPPYDNASPSQDDVVAALSAWIEAGCPNGAATTDSASRKSGPREDPGASKTTLR